MRAIERSFLTGLLITSALPLAVVWAGAPKVSAETIIVPTVPGSLDGAGGAGGVSPPGDPNGQPGVDGLPANADAGYSVPNNDALNSAAATGGNGGAGGNGVDDGNGGNGGSGGLATANAATAILSGSAEADAYSYGGNGGLGGGGSGSGSGGPGGAGGDGTQRASRQTRTAAQWSAIRSQRVEWAVLQAFTMLSPTAAREGTPPQQQRDVPQAVMSPFQLRRPPARAARVI